MHNRSPHMSYFFIVTYFLLVSCFFKNGYIYLSLYGKFNTYNVINCMQLYGVKRRHISDVFFGNVISFTF